MPRRQPIHHRLGPCRWPFQVRGRFLSPTTRLKDFLDRAFYPTQGQVTDKPYAAFVTHGGGGAAIGSIESIAQSFKLKKAADPVLVKGKPEGPALAALKALGRGLAAGVGKP